MAKKIIKTTVTTTTEEIDDNDDILINILLDRSGSMGGFEGDVIGHYNSYIKEQKALPGKAHVSLVLFDTEYEEVYLNKDINDVPKLTNEKYFVRGSTAYLDALGRLIKSVDALPNKPGKVVFVVNTDGLENASHEFTVDAIKKLVTDHQDKLDWQFVFIGAGIDALKAGTQIGMHAYSTFTAAVPAAGGIGASMNNLSQTTSNYRSGVTANMDTVTAQKQLDEEEKKKKVTTPKK